MSDALLIDLVSRVKPGVDVLFIDTGYHFAETIGTRDAVQQVYDVNVINVKPSRTVAEQERDLGPRLFGRNPDLCCYLRKVEPLNRALEPYLAWVSGIRRDEAVHPRRHQGRGVGRQAPDGQGQPDRRAGRRRTSTTTWPTTAC